MRISTTTAGLLPLLLSLLLPTQASAKDYVWVNRPGDPSSTEFLGHVPEIEAGDRIQLEKWDTTAHSRFPEVSIFDIEGVVGQGAMGRVFLLKGDSPKKVLKLRKLEDTRSAEFFADEVTSLKVLKNAKIETSELYATDGRNFIVKEYKEGVVFHKMYGGPGQLWPSLTAPQKRTVLDSLVSLSRKLDKKNLVLGDLNAGGLVYSFEKNTWSVIDPGRVSRNIVWWRDLGNIRHLPLGYHVLRSGLQGQLLDQYLSIAEELESIRPENPILPQFDLAKAQQSFARFSDWLDHVPAPMDLEIKNEWLLIKRWFGAAGTGIPRPLKPLAESISKKVDSKLSLISTLKNSRNACLKQGLWGVVE